MKGSETFKKVIKAYLDKRAAEDELFAKDYAKPGKNIDDCCDFIISRNPEDRGLTMMRFMELQFTIIMKKKFHSPRIRIAPLLQISQTRPRRIWRRRLRRNSSKPKSSNSRRRSPLKRSA